MAKLSAEFVLELSLRIMETVATTAEDFKLTADPETVYETGLQVASQGFALMLASKFNTSAEAKKDIGEYLDRVDKLVETLVKHPITSLVPGTSIRSHVTPSTTASATTAAPPINKKNLN